METLKALEGRKSWRSYTPKDVEQEKLEKVVAFANKAPNAGEFQVTVVRDKKLLQKINDETLLAMKNSGNSFLVSRASIEGYQPLYGANVFVVFSAAKSGYYQVNTATAATAVTIAATDFGLASCFIITPTLILDGKDELSKQLNLKEGFVPVCGVVLGYGEEKNNFSRERAIPQNINYV
ncbi:MAG: nitroreductase family protein [Campylobacteraceae bacterium]|jgi:nitroreductase|nr:nitroreductase family protein [Campylobacteraceae bacterium]